MQSCVSGPDDHVKMRNYLAKFGLQPTKHERYEEFICGDGHIDKSIVSWVYPVFIYGIFRGVIDIAECTVPCPPLFSLGMAEKWECISDHKKKQLILGKYRVTIPFRKSTPYLDVLDLDVVSKETIDLTEVPIDFILHRK